MTNSPLDQEKQRIVSELRHQYKNVKVTAEHLHPSLSQLSVDVQGLEPWLRESLDTLHAAVEESIRNERQERDIPMGVSQWKNHGKKWGYWEWFEKQIGAA